MNIRSWLLLIGLSVTLLSFGCKDEEPFCNGNEKQTIAGFLRDSSLNAQVTEDSVRYIVYEQGDSLRANPRDTISFIYAGRTLTGKEFDSSLGKPLNSIFAGLIPGFQSGLRQIGQGGVIKMIIPANRAYGNRPPPQSRLCPGTDLVFDVTLVRIGVFKF